MSHRLAPGGAATTTRIDQPFSLLPVDRMKTRRMDETARFSDAVPSSGSDVSLAP
jgi:hypothetical protein